LHISCTNLNHAPRPQRQTNKTPLEVPTLSQDKKVSLPVTLALCLALATACTKPAPPPPPQEPETPTVIKAVINTANATPKAPPSAIAFPDPGTGFAALGTTLVKTTDDSQTWTQVATFDAAITHLDFPTPDQGWAVTDTQQLLRSKDGGRTWQNENRLAKQVDFVSPTHGFTLEGGALFATKDGGQTWTQTGTSPCGSAGERWSRAFSFISPQDGWIACASQGGTGMQAKSVYRTRDGGASWDLTANAPFPANATDGKVGQIPAGGYLSSLFFLDEQHGWLGLSRGALFTTTDGGVTWKGVDGPMGQYERFIGGIQFLTPDRGYVIDHGILYATADGGQTFTPLLPALQPATALPMQMLDASRWASAGTSLDGGDILWTDDAGKTWRKVGNIKGETVDALRFAQNAKDGWALGTHWAPDASYIQTVYRTDDGGVTWQPLYQRNGITFINLRIVDATTLIASTNTGEIHISRDGGKTFTSLTGAEPQPPSHTLRFITADKGWRLRDFALEVTTDGGKTWTPSSLKTRVVEYELLPDGSAWVTGGEIRNGSHQSELFFTPDWGQSWTRFGLGALPGAGAVRCADRDHCLVIAGEAGRYFTADGGRTWEQRP
jgi:photosystem II stability/assembly factor-like uncharacterized protein